MRNRNENAPAVRQHRPGPYCSTPLTEGLNMTTFTGYRRQRKRLVGLANSDLFDFAREKDALDAEVVRKVSRRLGIPPATARLLAELAGFAGAGGRP